MFEQTPSWSTVSSIHSQNQTKVLADVTDLELATALAERSLIPHQDWHRLKGDRQAQAKQQLTAALVFLLKEQPEAALTHLQQAADWLNGSLKSPPCPDRDRRKSASKTQTH